MSKPNHDKSISIAKGIGITLMVIGHTSCPDGLKNWLLSFHMPLFFFISGYLFNVKHLDNFKIYLINKVRGYYVPFVKWSLIFLLLHNVLAYLNINNYNYSLNIYFDRILRAFTLRGSETLLGGYWFLIEMLLVSIMVYWPIRAVHKYAKPDWSRNLCLIFAVLVCLLATYFLGHTRVLFKIRNVTWIACAFFFAGHLYKNLTFRPGTILSATLCISSIMASQLLGWNFWIDSYGLTVFHMTGFALVIIIGILGFSSKISELRIGQVFDFIGMNTLVILTFHMLSFKVVSLYIIYRDSLPIEQLSDFPVIRNNNTFDWILYSIAGVVLPIIVSIALKNIKEKYILKSFYRIKSTILSVLQ